MAAYWGGAACLIRIPIFPYVTIVPCSQCHGPSRPPEPSRQISLLAHSVSLGTPAMPRVLLRFRATTLPALRAGRSAQGFESCPPTSRSGAGSKDVGISNSDRGYLENVLSSPNRKFLLGRFGVVGRCGNRTKTE